MARHKLTEEEKIELEKKRQLENNLKEIRSDLHLQPLPTYFFNVGDSVQIGNLQDVTITEVFEGGRYYQIQYSVTHNNYGNPYVETGLLRYVHWHQIRPFPTVAESFIQNDDVRLSFSQTSMSNILSKAYHFGLNLNPEYQRGYVWDDSDREALIDSIFHNIDIGKFCFIRKSYADDYLYEVLDGKQRIRTILDFYENRFAYKGKYFNDLCVRDRDWFENYHISCASVEECDQKTVLKYFLLLNRSGKHMEEEHLAKVEEMVNSL